MAYRSEMPAPHVILILSDEHRGQAMSHAGDPNLRTPQLDRLAAEGVSLGRAYSNCPVCTPSRGTIFSGRHAHASPVSGFFDVYSATAPSLATEFKAAGYRTAFFGKWHCGVVKDQLPPAVREQPDRFPGGSRQRTPERHRAGFEDWCAFESHNRHFDVSVYRDDATEPERIEGYETDVLVDEAIRYLQNPRDERPIFLVLSVTPPHFPLDAPDEFRRHDPATLELRPNVIEHPDPPGAANNPAPWLNPDQPWAPPDIREALASYYAMIENLDHGIGRLMDVVTPESLLCYISDHGEFLGSHGLCERKMHPHEESVRVPMIFYAPGRIPPQGYQTRGLAGLVDIAPTLLGLCNLPAPPWMQGKDLAAFVRGSDLVSQEVQLLEMHNPPRFNLDYVEWRGFVTHRYKYAYYETGTELLFDLEQDPYELHNLADDASDLLPAMRQQLLGLLRETREPFFDVLMEHGVACRPSRNVSGADYRVLSVRG
ncbi:MAG: arylsulfatase A-like enzyme [Rhodothermales bacterium]|jgi:arylsulfatase A-like enzyme